jgi:hypothetical protein
MNFYFTIKWLTTLTTANNCIVCEDDVNVFSFSTTVKTGSLALGKPEVWLPVFRSTLEYLGVPKNMLFEMWM